MSALTEILADHFMIGDYCCCDPDPECGLPAGPKRNPDEWAEHVAAAILADPRLAVVELPKPGNEGGQFATWETPRGLPNVYIDSGAVELGLRYATTPEHAHTLAVALLAAARKAGADA